MMQLLLMILRKFPLMVHSWGGWFHIMIAGEIFGISGIPASPCKNVRTLSGSCWNPASSHGWVYGCYLSLSQNCFGSLKNLNVGFVLAGLFFRPDFFVGIVMSHYWLAAMNEPTTTHFWTWQKYRRTALSVFRRRQ